MAAGLGLVAAGMTANALAQVPPATTPLAQPAAAQSAIVQTVDGRSFTGEVTVDEQGLVHLTTAPAGPQTLQFADLASIDLGGVVAAKKPVSGHTVLLRSGQQLVATALGGTAATANQPALLRVTTACAGNQDIPLRYVAAIRFLRADGVAAATFDADVAEPNATQDFLYIVRDQKAQRIGATVEAVVGDALKFELRGEAGNFGIDGLAAIVFGKNTGFAPDRQPRPRAGVQLATGSAIEGKLLAFSDTACRLRLDEGVELSIARDNVRRITVVSDKLTWLSELRPKVEQTPAFDRVWPWTVDRSPVGPGIQLGGNAYAHGLEMVPKTRLTYDLAGKYDLFEAMVGIDDRGGPQAHAVLRVFVDGAPAFESEPMTLGKAPAVVRLQLQKAKTLVLEADFGKNFDLGDLCVFADARVVQQ